MARIWANCLENGSKMWENVPVRRQDAVKTILKEDVKSGRNGMTAAKYKKITGETYK